MDRVKCLVRVFDGRENESFCCDRLKVFFGLPWTYGKCPVDSFLVISFL
jgi:hypothetical protein